MSLERDAGHLPDLALIAELFRETGFAALAWSGGVEALTALASRREPEDRP